MASGRFSIEAIFKAKDRFAAPVAKMATKMQSFTRSAGSAMRGLDRATSKMTAGLKKAGLVLGAAAGTAVAASAALLGTGVDFEQAIANVGAVGLKTVAEIKDLEDRAIQLGSTTKFTATEAANAMEIMARAGFSSKEILSGVDGVLSAAAASGLEMAEVSDVVAKTLKGMGLQTDQAARVADVLALASSKTNSTIGTLGESMKNVAATAAQFGIGLEETVASVALLQDVGLDASVAGSAMNTMLTKLAKPTATVKKQLNALGVEFADAQGNMLEFPEIVNNLGKAMKGAGGNMDQVALIADLVGLRGQKAALQLAKLGEVGEDGQSKLSKLTAQLGKAKGKADEMAKLRLQTVKGEFTLLMSAVDGVRIAIFKNSGGFRDTIERVRQWTDANKDLIATNIGEFFKKFVDNLPKILKWTILIAKGIGIWLGIAAAVKVATIATTIYTGVVKVLSIVKTVFMGILKAVRLAWVAMTFVTRLSTIAMVANKVATAASTVVLGLQRAAQFALTVDIGRATAAMVLQSAKQLALKISTGATTAIVWLQTTATKVGALAMGGYSAATGTAAAASVGLKAALVPLLPVLAAATAAIGALMVAFDQANKLSKETEGLGVTGIIGGMIDKGTFDPFEVVNQHQNQKARERARQRQAGGATASGVVSPQERITRSLAETNTFTQNTLDINVNDPGGRATVVGSPGPNASLVTSPSGAF